MSYNALAASCTSLVCDGTAGSDCVTMAQLYPMQYSTTVYFCVTMWPAALHSYLRSDPECSKLNVSYNICTGIIHMFASAATKRDRLHLQYNVYQNRAVLV